MESLYGSKTSLKEVQGSTDVRNQEFDTKPNPKLIKDSLTKPKPNLLR